jgi:hypothetical protein
VRPCLRKVICVEMLTVVVHFIMCVATYMEAIIITVFYRMLCNRLEFSFQDLLQVHGNRVILQLHFIKQEQCI